MHADVREFFDKNMYDKVRKGTPINIAYERMGDKKMSYLTETGTEAEIGDLDSRSPFLGMRFPVPYTAPEKT